MPVKHTVNQLMPILLLELDVIMQDSPPQSTNTDWLMTNAVASVHHNHQISLQDDTCSDPTKDQLITENATKWLLSQLYVQDEANEQQVTYLDKLKQRFNHWRSKNYWSELTPSHSTILTDDDIKAADNNRTAALIQLDHELDVLFWDTIEQLPIEEVILRMKRYHIKPKT